MTLSEDFSAKNVTIIAPATPLGRGAIAIARLSGPKALEIALLVVKKDSLTPRYAHLLYLYDCKDQPFDRAIVIYFKAPKSYTGEEVVEFQTHGGLAALSVLIETLKSYGAVLARAGEFSLRAVKNGKMTIEEAEAAAAYASAIGAKAANLLAKHLRGDLGRFVDDIRTRLLRLIAYSETSIDYADEELGDTQKHMLDQLDELERILQSTIESSRRRRGLLRGFEIAIIGKPNVGKSSLLNALLGEARSIVSDQAGTTRDLVSEELRIGEHIVKILDTAGLRHSENQIEAIGVEYAKKAAKKADLIIALFDGSSAFENSDREVLELTRDRLALLAINKSDLSQKIDLSFFENRGALAISAKSTITPLIEALETTLNKQIGSEETMLVSERQIELVERAAERLNLAKSRLIDGELELFSYLANEAIVSIGSITSPSEYGELLDIMFSEFCLGK
ncbi:MAG: tRNA uridine-5-carboxymethylaminomethyl(34) synthesis GTPase MnmE [Helicobacteraceae bacterium]|jgi:tRNA modification GTPase|nr:tRNA uridine-5-carboxymethylaminomethyl(34) synthesis GTPase MnmE [Helicobacteraceae bacterium]